MLDTIFMTIFGISLIDNFGFEFINILLIEIKSITSNIVEYLSNTECYNYLRNLFFKKQIIEKRFPSSRSNVETNSIETARNEKSIIQGERNSRIVD
jgi:hypothetical protein